MLTEAEKQEIEALFKEYRFRKAVCTDALKIVQRHRGWVSDEALKDIAGFLEMTPDEVDGVATFYSHIYRKPLGKHLILICDSVSCWIMGYERVVEHLSARLGIGPGGTSKDNRFTLLPIACLGVCEQAPAMIIDDIVYGDLDENKIDQILSQYE